MPIYQQSVFGESPTTSRIPGRSPSARAVTDTTPGEPRPIRCTDGHGGDPDSEKDQGITPKASMSYQFTKDLMVYATAAKGFRPAAAPARAHRRTAHLRSPATAGVRQRRFVNGPISFKSDNIWSYEVGEKLRLADNRVTVNGSLYFEKWSGVQQTNALSSCGYVYTANAGDAHVRGGELEIQAIVVPNSPCREMSVTRMRRW